MARQPIKKGRTAARKSSEQAMARQKVIAKTRVPGKMTSHGDETIPKRVKRPMVDNARMGAMTPEDFEAAASDALGGRGWQKAWRAGTGQAQSTLTRYLRGQFPIPQHVAIIVEMLQTLRHHGFPVPEAFTIRK